MTEFTLALFIGVEVDETDSVMAEVRPCKVVVSPENSEIILRTMFELLTKLADGDILRPGAVGNSDITG